MSLKAYVESLSLNSYILTEITSNTSYDEVEAYFLHNLPIGLSEETFRRTACIGVARLLVEKLGGPQNARIIWFEDHNTDGKSTLDMHAYVVKTDATKNDQAYCCHANMKRKIGDILPPNPKSEDITEQVMSSPWDKMEI